MNNLHFGTDKGKTIGLLFGAGYDIPLSKTMAICIQASYHTEKITEITWIDEIKGDTGTETFESKDAIKGVLKFSLGVRFAK